MKQKHYVVLGLGLTGWSCVRHLSQQGHRVTVTDDRQHPPYLEALQAAHLAVRVYTGCLDHPVLLSADVLIVSPGIPPHHPVIQAAKARGQRLQTDLDLFAAVTQVPYLLVTGTNGKSTVVTLLGQLLSAAGFRVHVVGNIGAPVLDCLAKPADWVVIEVSSYALHYSAPMCSQGAVVLNVSADHLDWHTELAAYYQAKQRVYLQSAQVLLNIDQPEAVGDAAAHTAATWFGRQPQALWQIQADGTISYQGKTVIWATDYSASAAGLQANITAACALAHMVGVACETMRPVVQAFTGLDYRCQRLGAINQVDWINDSKATNLHAVLASVEACVLQYQAGVILLLGGQPKVEDWSTALPRLAEDCAHLLLFGAAREALSALCDQLNVRYDARGTMAEAVATATALTQPHQVLLLSPGGASFDEFDHFAHRGAVFNELFAQRLAQQMG